MTDDAARAAWATEAEEERERALLALARLYAARLELAQAYKQEYMLDAQLPHHDLPPYARRVMYWPRLLAPTMGLAFLGYAIVAFTVYRTDGYGTPVIAGSLGFVLMAPYWMSAVHRRRSRLLRARLLDQLDSAREVQGEIDRMILALREWLDWERSARTGV